MSTASFSYSHLSTATPYQTPYDPYHPARPAVPSNPSQKSYATAQPVASVWPTSWDNITQHTLTTRYGSETWLSVVAAIILLAAGSFSLYASTTGIVFPISSLSGRTINVPNISALISAISSIMTGAFVFSLSIVGRRWILRQIEHGKSIRIGQWSAIASSGSIFDLPQAGGISRGLFLIIAAAIQLASPAMSGALVPSVVTGSSVSWVEVVRLKGAYGKPYAASMVACDETHLCPANFFGPAIETAMLQGVTGNPPSANGYYTIGESRYASLDATSLQSQVEYAVLRVPSHRMNDRQEALSIEACMTAVSPLVSCAVSENPDSIRRTTSGSLSFEDLCGQVIYACRDAVFSNSGLPSPSMRPFDRQSREARLDADFGAFSFFCNATDNAWLFSYVLYESSDVTRYDCSISANEEDVRTVFDASRQIYQRGDSCGGSVQLDTTEMLPLVSSVSTILSRSQYGDGVNALAAMVSQGGDKEVKLLEQSITAGMDMVAGTLYFLARGTENQFMATGRAVDSIPTFVRVPAIVRYRSYGWEHGYKSYAWGGILCLAGTLALFCAALGTRRRLRYNPSDWIQTVLIGLNSRDLVAPGNTDSGALPKKYKLTELQYGRVASGQRAQFTMTAPSARL